MADVKHGLQVKTQTPTGRRYVIQRLEDGAVRAVPVPKISTMPIHDVPQRNLHRLKTSDGVFVDNVQANLSGTDSAARRISARLEHQATVLDGMIARLRRANDVLDALESASGSEG